ncbi:unnamed protein product [Cercospora beticola]|nr:unnamed protein product [Cercospora beticola]
MAFALSTSLVLHGLRDFATEDLLQNRDKSLSLPSLVQEAYKDHKGGDSAVEIGEFTSDLDVLRKALWGGDALKLTLRIIYRVMTKNAGRKKTLVYFYLPRSALYLWRILRFIGVNAILLTQDQGVIERGEIIRNWNNSKDGAQVLIATYALQLAGVNAHDQCCTVIMPEASFNIASD